MNNPEKSTILYCYFAECVQFLNGLDVSLCDNFFQNSFDYREHEQSIYAFNEDRIEFIFQAIYGQANLPNIGLQIGKRVRFGFDGREAIPFHLKLSLKKYLWAFSRYLSNFLPKIFIEFFERNNIVGYKLIINPDTTPHQHFYIEALAAIIYNFLHFLMGHETEPEYISFNYSQPLHYSSYREHFHCDLHFDKSQFEFAINRDLANSPIKLKNSNIVSFSQRYSAGDLFPLQLYSLSRHIHKILEQNNEKAPSVDHVAKSLQISTRTLRRKLFQLNSTFQKEIDYFRRDMAFKYLLSQDIDITNIALLLGYYDSSAFNKAFKKWSGIAPSEFKKRFCGNIDPIPSDTF